MAGRPYVRRDHRRFKPRFHAGGFRQRVVAWLAADTALACRCHHYFSRFSFVDDGMIRRCGRQNHMLITGDHVGLLGHSVRCRHGRLGGVTAFSFSRPPTNGRLLISPLLAVAGAHAGRGFFSSLHTRRPSSPDGAVDDDGRRRLAQAGRRVVYRRQFSEQPAERKRFVKARWRSSRAARTQCAPCR